MYIRLALRSYVSPDIPWFLYQMVAHFTLRTYDVNNVFF